MHTPLTHKTIKHPKGRGKHTYKYNMLIDGVHMSEKAKSEWAKTLTNAVKLNRAPESEEEDEPKRGWRVERHRNLVKQ